jgi:hypothetical protein
MARRPLPAEIASDLRYHQRVMLFCLASGNDWRRAGVTEATAQHLLTSGLIVRARTPARFQLTTLGHNVLALLFKPPVDEQDG